MSLRKRVPAGACAERLILYGCGDLINDDEGIDPHGARRSDITCLYVAALDAGSGRLVGLRNVPLQVRRFCLCAGGRAGRYAH